MKKTNYPFPDLILFDWDNTLMDTTPALYQAFCVLCEKYGIPKCSMEEYRARTGMSLRETFPALFGDRWEEAKQVYLDAYRANHLNMLTPFDKARETVAFLHEKTGGKTGVVSNKTGAILREEIDHLGWGGYFAAVVGAGDAFCAGVSIGLTYGKSLPEAIDIGAQLAASVITSSENVCPRFLPKELGLDIEVED